MARDKIGATKITRAVSRRMAWAGCTKCQKARLRKAEPENHGHPATLGMTTAA